ncbi:MAG: hypothetical protein M3347_06720 [Armatimonadota bacterium]|nr:hypothetical protein [Armatimonadota bacterium]
MKKKTGVLIALALGIGILGGQAMPAQACEKGHKKPPTPTTPAPEEPSK